MTERKLYLGPLTDSRRWDMVDIRPDDVIVVTPPKSGTTWMQTMIALLISGDPEVRAEPATRMPWVDMRLREMPEVADRLAAMTQRRCLKSHTPMDGLPVDERAQYICVFRHPLDAHFSYRKHLRNIPMTWFAHWYPENDTDGMTFRRFLDGGAEGFDADAMPLAHIIRHFLSAKALARRSNVALFHFADMMRDPDGAFARVADILSIAHPPETIAQLRAVATFEHMRAHADRFAPGGGTGFLKSDAAFFDSATSGKWIGVLSDAALRAYDAAMNALLSPEDRAWLEYGAAGPP